MFRAEACPSIDSSEEGFRAVRFTASMMRLTAAIGMMTVIAAASFAAEKGGVYRLHSSDTRSISQGSCVAIDMPDKRQHFLTVGHVIGGNMQVENDGRFFPVRK